MRGFGMRSDLFEGIRVLDLGMVHAGVAAGYMMGDLGAEIIKIEDTKTGDNARAMASIFGSKMQVKGRAVHFELSNRNKRGLVLNLKKDEGREVFYNLVKKSDVFCTNFHPDTLKKLGATYDILSKINPRLIYVVSSTFGLKGPRGHVRRGYDVIGWAYSGGMWAAGERDSDEPQWVVGAMIDQLTAVYAAYGISAALFHRERTGKGQKLEISLAGSAINLQAMAINAVGLGAGGYKRQARKRALNPLSNHYRCSDDEWILLCEVQSGRFWHEFCEMMGLKDIENDPRFVDFTARSKHRTELVKILDKTFATKARKEWLDIFDKSTSSMAYSPVNRWTDLLEDPQVLENKYIVPFDHPVLGPVKVPGFPIDFSECPQSIRREAPEYGQHTEEILKEMGYSWEDIGRLQDEEVIN
jgi:crotonobetainyl-CoA:carnitine CoA-transferase CaiB-like acyl-CoA transferase